MQTLQLLTRFVFKMNQIYLFIYHFGVLSFPTLLRVIDTAQQTQHIGCSLRSLEELYSKAAGTHHTQSVGSNGVHVPLLHIQNTKYE